MDSALHPTGDGPPCGSDLDAPTQRRNSYPIADHGHAAGVAVTAGAS